MRTGIGHGAVAKIFHQLKDFSVPQGIVGFYGVPTNGFGDDEFGQSTRVHTDAGRFEFVDQLDGKLFGVGSFDGGWEAVEKKGAITKLAEPDSEFG